MESNFQPAKLAVTYVFVISNSKLNPLLYTFLFLKFWYFLSAKFSTSYFASRYLGRYCLIFSSFKPTCASLDLILWLHFLLTLAFYLVLLFLCCFSHASLSWYCFILNDFWAEKLCCCSLTQWSTVALESIQTPSLLPFYSFVNLSGKFALLAHHSIYNKKKWKHFLNCKLKKKKKH